MPEGSLIAAAGFGTSLPREGQVAIAEDPNADPLVSCGPDGPVVRLSELQADPSVCPQFTQEGEPVPDELIVPTFQQTNNPPLGNVSFGDPALLTGGALLNPNPDFDVTFPGADPDTSGSGSGTSGQDEPFFDDTTILGNIGAIILEGASAIFTAIINAPQELIQLAAVAFGRPLTNAEAQAVQAAFQQDPQRLAQALALVSRERLGLVDSGTETTGGTDTMATDPFTQLAQNLAGCDERFFRPAPERVRAVPLLCVKRPDGGDEFYINIKLNRSKLIRMEASRGRRRSKR